MIILPSLWILAVNGRQLAASAASLHRFRNKFSHYRMHNPMAVNQNQLVMAAWVAVRVPE